MGLWHPLYNNQLEREQFNGAYFFKWDGYVVTKTLQGLICIIAFS